MPQRRIAKPKKKTAKKVVPRRTAAPLALSGDCGLSEAEALKSRLLAALAREAPVTLDLAELTSIDAANLQLLAAFVRDRRSKDRAVTWQAVPSWFESAVRRIGLAAALGTAQA